MSVLIDTNILLRRAQPTHPSNVLAVNSVAKLLASGEDLCITLQNVAEFWNVATRPVANNGLGFSVDFVAQTLEDLESEFTVLDDSPAIYEEWKRLVILHKVIGSKVHDARLAAAMNVHGTARILTFNVGDFSRFELEAIHPSDVAV